MKYTLNFTELGKDDAPIAGGKGASLGEMTRAGIPVPDGFVVLADTFDIFLRDTDLVQEIDTILDGVNHEAIHTVERASEDIQALILSRPMPESMQTEIQEKFQALGSQYVAVRSSATAEDGAEHRLQPDPADAVRTDRDFGIRRRLRSGVGAAASYR